MKTIRTLVLIALSIALLPSFSSGQLLNKLKKKIEEKLEDRTVEEVDKSMDEVLDSIFSSSEKGEKPNGPENYDFGAMFGTDVPVEEVYKFDMQYTVQMEHTNKGKTEESTMETYWNNEGDYMGVVLTSLSKGDVPKLKTIIDFKNDATIVLMEENKSIITLSMKEPLDEASDYIMVEDLPQKTGRTKTISGYHCEEYRWEGEEGVSHVWMTKESAIDLKQFGSGLNEFMKRQRKKGYVTHKYEGLEGFPIQTIYESNDGKETTTMTVTDFKKAKNSFSTEGYSKMF